MPFKQDIDPTKAHAFLKELTKLTRKYGFSVHNYYHSYLVLHPETPETLGGAPSWRCRYQIDFDNPAIFQFLTVEQVQAQSWCDGRGLQYINLYDEGQENGEPKKVLWFKDKSDTMVRPEIA